MIGNFKYYHTVNVLERRGVHKDLCIRDESGSHSHVRGFLERKKQNNARFVPVTGPNGSMSIPTSGFRAVAAKRAAEKRNLNRMLQGFANN